MAPSTSIPLSPAELSYLHTSLAQQTPPLRPDGRAPTQFRPLVAETDVLPGANGSARICFADGTEAVVGVKAEVEKSRARFHQGGGGGGGSGEVAAEGVLGLGRGEGGDGDDTTTDDDDDDDGDGDEDGDEVGAGRRRRKRRIGKGRDEWLEIAIEIPGLRDDDALPTFLAAMLAEALLSAGGGLQRRLRINARFHWRLYVDVLLLSQPLSYPLPLLSWTTHLALLATRMPTLVSEKDEDPLFDDDWEAATFLYPRRRPDVRGSGSGSGSGNSSTPSQPPVTLLVMSVGDNIIFDPSQDELAVADAALAVSVAPSSSGGDGGLRLVALRTVDPPSRLTAAGVPNVLNTTAAATTGAPTLSPAEALAVRELDQGQSVWRPPRGGVRRSLVTRMIKMAVEKGGVGDEVLQSLARVES